MISSELDVILNDVQEIEAMKTCIMRKEKSIQLLPIAMLPEVFAVVAKVISVMALPVYEARVAYVFSALVMFSPFTFAGRKPPRGLRNKIAEHLGISKGHASHEITRVVTIARLNNRLKPLLNDVFISVIQEISALNGNVS